MNLETPAEKRVTKTHIRAAMCLVMVLAVAVGEAQQQPEATLRIHVTATVAEGTGFKEPEWEGLGDSARDLEGALRRRLRRSHHMVVDSQVGADLVVEVVGRLFTPPGSLVGTNLPNHLGGFSTVVVPMSGSAVFLRLRAGDYERRIVGQSRGKIWRAAADDAARKLQRWLSANREELLKRRLK